MLFAVDNGFERIFFNASGFTYEFLELVPLSHGQMEKAERRQQPFPDKNKTASVHLSWLNTNGAQEVIPGDVQPHYLTFGGPEYNSRTFKKITYKNLYPNIDVEYLVPRDSVQGVKYNVILHPGADPGKLRMAYTGDTRGVSLMKNGSVRIRGDIDDIIEQPPVTFSREGKQLRSRFVVENGEIAFQVDGYNPASGAVIDPWISTTATLTTNSAVFDVDYDFLGNTYAYGGVNPFKVACYNAAGVLQWVFGGSIINPSWTSAPINNYASNFGVNRMNSKCFIGQGYNGTGSQVVRLTATGNYDNFINAANMQFQEVWDMGFHCITADVFVLGGGTTSNITAVTINSISAALTLSAFQPTVSAAGQDIVSHAIDDQGNLFVLGAGSNFNQFYNRLLHVNSTFNGNLWSVWSGYGTFAELQNKSGFNMGVTSNGYNALAVNANYLFYYDGGNLAAYNKVSGAPVVSVATGGVAKSYGGIAVDDCNNLYVGADGFIKTYSFNGTAFSTLTPISLSLSTTNQKVFDIKLDKQTKTLYVSGAGFCGVYIPQISYSCPTMSSACVLAQGGISVNSTSISCASLGSATVTPVGGNGPYSFTWIPSGQQGSVATNMAPGFHQIVVHDAGINGTYTAGVNLLPVTPLSGTVPGTINLACHGVANGTAAIANFAGGSGLQTYSWTNGVSSQTTPVATNLNAGAYTVTVVDGLTNCVLTQTFNVIMPTQVTLNVVPGATAACAGSSIFVMAQIGGGTPNYTFSWTNGPATGTAQLSGPPGTHDFTLTGTDASGCQVVKTVSLNFLNTPTLVVTSASVCPGQNGTLMVSGASTYTWNGINTGNTLTDAPAATTVYTVTGSGTQCSSKATGTITLKPLPVPTVGPATTVCTSSKLQLQAGGGVSFAWSGPLGYTSTEAAPVFYPPGTGYSGAYQVTVTAANNCTATTAMDVTVFPLPVVSAVGSTVCENGVMTLQGSSNDPSLGYSWNGPQGFSSLHKNVSINTPSTSMSGQYTLEVNDLNGCKSKAVTHVTISSVPVATVTAQSPVCEQQDLKFSAVAQPGGLTFGWQGPNGFSSIVSHPLINSAPLAANGIYTLSVKNGPCSVSFTTSAVVNPLPVIGYSGSPDVCETKTLVLTASATGTITGWDWRAPDGKQSNYHDFVRPGADASMAGVYTVTAVNNHGCVNSANISVKVLPNPTLSVADATVCLFSPHVFSASGAQQYLWTGPDGFSAQVPTPTLAGANHHGTTYYHVTGTAVNGCSASAGVALSTRDLPVPAISVSPGAHVCEGGAVSLEGHGGVFYNWKGPFQLHYSGKKLDMTIAHHAAAGDFTLTAFDAMGCGGSTVTTIYFHEKPTGYLSGVTGECVPFCADYASMLAENVTGSWKINGGPVSGTEFTYCFSRAQTYTISGLFTDTLTNCTASQSFFVTGFPKPEAKFTFSPERPVEYADDVTFSVLQPEQGMHYYWFFDNKPGSVKGVEYSTTFESEGQYRVALVAQTSHGCSDSLVKAIEVLPTFNIFVPNAFTPNGDALNNEFTAVTRGVSSFHMQVFNRWGALLFETNDPSLGWNGSYQGKPCPNDVYVYKLEATDIHGNPRKMTGFVTLQR